MLIAVVRMDDGWLLAQWRLLEGRDGGMVVQMFVCKQAEARRARN